MKKNEFYGKYLNYPLSAISTEMIKAMENEVISGASLATCFKIPAPYISFIKNKENWHKIPEKTWDLFNEWFESGLELREFGLIKDNEGVHVPPIPDTTKDALQKEIDRMEETLRPIREENTPIVGIMERLQVCFKELIHLGYGVKFSLTYKQKQVK